MKHWRGRKFDLHGEAGSQELLSEKLTFKFLFEK